MNKVLILNGSPHQHGCTATALDEMIKITAMIESVSAVFQPTEEQLAMFIEMFVGQLPEYIRNSLAKAGFAA